MDALCVKLKITIGPLRSLGMSPRTDIFLFVSSGTDLHGDIVVVVVVVGTRLSLNKDIFLFVVCSELAWLALNLRSCNQDIFFFVVVFVGAKRS